MKNQGLISTIENHINKIKNIENNFANSAHGKEVFEKTKHLENHVIGPPRLHNSWRELLLTGIVIGGIIWTMVMIGKKRLPTSHNQICSEKFRW